MNWFTKPKEEVKVTIVDIKAVIDLASLTERLKAENRRLVGLVKDSGSKRAETERLFACAKAEIAMLRSKLAGDLPFQGEETKLIREWDGK